MKKQNFTHSILYTKNSLEPVDNKNIQIANPFGSFANMNYDYSIVWVPETRNGDARLLRITPQYKFGCAKSSSDNDWTNATASSSNVSFDVSSNNTEITLLPLASPTNYTDYTDNIVIKLETAINNNASSININTTLSNYSSILSDSETNIYYNMSFRLKLEIYNQTSETVEDTSYSKYYCVRFGRSNIENVGDSPLLPWDKKEDGTPYPLISKRKRRTKVFDGQSSGDGVGGDGVGPSPPPPPSPPISCNCLGANAILLASSNLPVVFDGKSFNFGTNYIYGPYDAGDASARFPWMENPRYSEYWDYTFDTFYGNHVFRYKKYQTGFETPQDTVLQKIISVYKTEEGSVPDIICNWRASISITAQGLDPDDYCIKDIIAEFSCKDTCESFKINSGYTAEDILALPFGSPSNNILVVNYDDVGSNFGGSCELPTIGIGSQVCN